MTSATTDVTTVPDAAIDAGSAAETAAHDQHEAAAADRVTHDADAKARKARRQDNAAWASLAVGLLISLVTFGSIAWTNSVASTGGERPAPVSANP